MGVTEKEYKKMLAEDVNSVMIKVLKSAKGGSTGLLPGHDGAKGKGDVFPGRYSAMGYQLRLFVQCG